jgi:hypothetical protein
MLNEISKIIPESLTSDPAEQSATKTQRCHPVRIYTRCTTKFHAFVIAKNEAI